MATSRYDVVYRDGRKRVKLLSPESATKLGDQKGIESVKRASQPTRRGHAAKKEE